VTAAQLRFVFLPRHLHPLRPGNQLKFPFTNRRHSIFLLRHLLRFGIQLKPPISTNRHFSFLPRDLHLHLLRRGILFTSPILISRRHFLFLLERPVSGATDLPTIDPVDRPRTIVIPTDEYSKAAEGPSLGAAISVLLFCCILLAEFLRYLQSLMSSRGVAFTQIMPGS